LPVRGDDDLEHVRIPHNHLAPACLDSVFHNPPKQQGSPRSLSGSLFR
jgi:hypothetical protein